MNLVCKIWVFVLLLFFFSQKGRVPCIVKLDVMQKTGVISGFTTQKKKKKKCNIKHNKKWVTQSFSPLLLIHHTAYIKAADKNNLHNGFVFILHDLYGYAQGPKQSNSVWIILHITRNT